MSFPDVSGDVMVTLRFHIVVPGPHERVVYRKSASR